MDIGLTEILIILALIVVLFVVFKYVVKLGDKRYNKRAQNVGTPSNDKPTNRV